MSHERAAATPFRYAVITSSDRCASGERDDASGPLACQLVEAMIPASLVSREVVPDDKASLEATLRRCCDELGCALVVTTGGTGLAPRDVTPEATRAVLDREVPGIAEAMRAAGLAHTPHAMLSRGICGLRGRSLIINLSGSPKAVREQLDAVAPVLSHALRLATDRPDELHA